MDKPVILCLGDDSSLLAALRTALQDEFSVEMTTEGNAIPWIENAVASGVEIALVLSRAEEAPFALPSLTLSEPVDAASLAHAVRQEVLERKLQAIYDRTEVLESLNDVGVALSGSFDIHAILKTTHQTAMNLASASAVDVLYLRCETIHSKAMWFPTDPADHNIDARTREEILERFEGGSEPPQVVRSEGRQCFPISYQDEHLGLLFVTSGAPPGIDTGRLLSILTLQAATALRNIHLTQERIQFERLSAIGRMIGSVVHDFRGPLTALRGFAGMLTGANLTDGERESYGQYVVEECDRLNQMVGELLEFTRGGSFKLASTAQPVGPYFDALAERLRAQYGARVGVQLEVDYAGDIHVDAKRMDRALWNLLTNAVQAMPDGGGRLTLRSTRVKDAIVLSVEDDGPGIPEEIRHRVFEPFFSYGKASGIGLGMLTAKKIAEAHGGSLDVTRTDSSGTTVSIHLPVSPMAEAEPLAVAASENRAR